MRGGFRAVLQGGLLAGLPKRPFTFDVVILLVHMICVGLPIALSVSRAAPKA